MATALGDTAYSINAPLVIHAGNSADGRTLWIANVDPANAVSVQVSGSIEGDRTYSLTGKGDWISIPTGDVTIVTVEASAYPTLIGFAFLPPGMAVGSGLRR